MKRGDKATQREDDVYKFLCTYGHRNGGQKPTYREICEALDISSTSLASRYVEGLVRRKLVKLKEREYVNGSFISIVGEKYSAP